MKKTLLVLLSAACFSIQAQEFSGIDKSPLDAAYFPNGSAHDITFAKSMEEKAELMTKVKVVYSRPQAKGRDIFGGIVKMDTPWRIGANETTEITFYAPVQIGDTVLVPGTYALYLTPTKDSWTLGINPFVGGWGIYKFDFSKDLAHVLAKPVKSKETIEELSITMYEAKSGMVHLKIGWGNHYAEFPFKVL